MLVVYSILIILSAGIIIGAFFCFYCWRSSAFDTVSAYLQNVKRIPEGEAAKIRAGSSEIYHVCGTRHKPMIYFEYSYKANGKEYIKDYFYEDDDDSPLPRIVKMHYHRKHPKRCYREGATKEGYIMGVLFLIFGLILFVPSLMCILQ